jgi:perosamine synthetase
MIPVNEPLLNGNEKKYLQECIDTGWISSEGPFVKKFEKNFAKFIGRKHAIAVANGTAAIDIAIAASGLQKGDEIILPSFTIISCISEILRRGIIPVWIDADPLTWNMNTHLLESLITSRTKAIMVVHLYGLPTDMDNVITVAETHNLLIIEDSSEAHGLLYKKRNCGSFGIISTFSFYANKIITTGEGGMILTDRDDLAEKMNGLRNLCFIPEQRFLHYDLGWNYRITNLQAAIGLAQLERIEELITIKKSTGLFYHQLLEDLSDELLLPLPKTEYAENIYWVFGLVLKKHKREELVKFLYEQGIATRPFFYPLHQQPVLEKFGLVTKNILPITENLAANGFYLPSGMAITEEQIIYISDKVKKFFKKA